MQSLFLQLSGCCLCGCLVVIPLDIVLLEVACVLMVAEQVEACGLILAMECALFGVGLVLARQKVTDPFIDPFEVEVANVTANDDLLDFLGSLLEFVRHDNTRLAEVREELFENVATQKIIHVRIVVSSEEVIIPPLL